MPPACSFCGSDGPVMAGQGIGICLPCAEIAVEMLGEQRRAMLLKIAVRIVRLRNPKNWPPLFSGFGWLTPGYRRKVQDEFARLTGAKAAA